jgi:hypothetical protein
MSLLRLLLLALITYLVFRMVRVFSNLRRGSGSDDAFMPPHSEVPDRQNHVDLPHGEIKDAEFIDLTPPENPPKPPKAS